MLVTCGPPSVEDGLELDSEEREGLLDALMERLRAEGAPAGVWMVEIAQAREQLATIDSLLRRLASAIVDGLSP